MQSTTTVKCIIKYRPVIAKIMNQWDDCVVSFKFTNDNAPSSKSHALREVYDFVRQIDEMLIFLLFCYLIHILLCNAEIFFTEDHICRNSSACERNLPCQLFDNVTCILDPRENCRPRFISTVSNVGLNFNCIS